jgi:hypothetical protein
MDFETELKYCMERTNSLMSQYVMRYVDKNWPVRTVELLKRACQTDLGATVSTGTVDVAIPAKGSALKAFWIRENGAFHICLTPGQNQCWKRFATCKELFHIIIDKEEYRTTDLLPHIGEMTTARPFSEAASPAVIAEHLAEIGAMEYLLPFSCRQAERASVVNGDYMPIAKKYLVPLIKVERFLSDEYMTWLAPFSPKG